MTYRDYPSFSTLAYKKTPPDISPVTISGYLYLGEDVSLSFALELILERAVKDHPEIEGMIEYITLKQYIKIESDEAEKVRIHTEKMRSSFLYRLFNS